MKLGILGGGQLAQMLTLAAYPLGIRTVCLDPNAEACSHDLTTMLHGEFTDTDLLKQFLQTVDVVTFETENIPLACAEFVAQHKPIYPSLKALEITQDRLHEKNFFQSMQVPTPAFFDITSQEDLEKAVEKTGLPAILKTRRFGYDGKGQYLIKNKQDVANAWDKRKSAALILEGFVNFEYEVSLISVRSKNGETAFYPLVRNHHESAILHHSEAPFANAQLQQQAEAYAEKILNEMNYVGVLTIEFFFDGTELIANEMAPRVHNSGHWTIEGAQTSQFENHVRAVCGLPLGSTAPMGKSFMLNLVGEIIDPESGPQLPGLHYHLYGKAPRPNRKLGHITLCDTDVDRFQTSKHTLLASAKTT
jgi:5-(carboxyamino)imidazole ribonucleotide synthase